MTPLMSAIDRVIYLMINKQHCFSSGPAVSLDDAAPFQRKVNRRSCLISKVQLLQSMKWTRNLAMT